MVQNLTELSNKIKRCKRCRLYQHATQVVPGEGSSRAKIMFIGEAPGKEEDKTGRPFVGMSGKFLDKLFLEAGIDRKKIFITSVIKHRPPNNRDPEREELEACKIWWQKQLEIIKPRLVVLLGRIATKTVLDEAVNANFVDFPPTADPPQVENSRNLRYVFKEIRGKLIKIGKTTYLPVYHPAAAIRFTKFRDKLKKDFQLLKKYATKSQC